MEKKHPITKAKAAEFMAKFIAENWHFCPVDENWNIPDCECWGSEKCKKCLLRNADHIKVDF